MPSSQSTYGAHEAASQLAQLFQRVARQSYDDFESISITEDDNVANHAHQALAVLPRCYALPDDLPVDETCAMPDAVCHPCTRGGRHLPPVS